MATPTTDPVRLPPGPRLPATIQGITVLTARHGSIAALGRRYGHTFTLRLPVFGTTVVVSDPVLVKDLFTTSRELIGRPKHNLGEILGSGSMFALDGDELLARRRLLLPPFHAKRVQDYEGIIESEVVREIADWPQGREFPTLEPMMRITLNAILRAVFGADGPALDELRRLIPTAVTLGSLLGLTPAFVRKDYGTWSPGGRLRACRDQIDAVIAALIAEARADPAFEDRTDMLALMLAARYDNGDPIPDQHIADELLTMLAAGHETTSTTLAWAVERIRRQPRLLARLTEEADAGGSALRQATIWEVQRTRPVLTAAIRRTKTRIRLGDWVIPQDSTVMASIQLAHCAPENFPDAEVFDPDRFDNGDPHPFSWIPFGGGMNRCIGAAFANMEMDVTLRTLLRELQIMPTGAADERRHNRGVTIAPAGGGRAVVYRRRAEAPSSSVRSSLADHPLSR